MITVALAKGALLRDSVERFQTAGLDFSAVLDPDNRQLMVPSTCGRARALLVRNGDVPVYVAYGQAQLGIVGYDVLREHQMPVAHLVDLGFGGCRMSVAVKSSSGYTRATDLPPHCRVASKFTRCARQYFDSIDLPVELVHLTGSVELGPITGIAPLLTLWPQDGRCATTVLLPSRICFIQPHALSGIRLPCDWIRENSRRSLMSCRGLHKRRWV